jgi:heme-degrading monooxygenase HmoA
LVINLVGLITISDLRDRANSSIAIPKIKFRDYFEHMQRDLLPSYKGAPGLDSVHILQRELVAYVEITTVSLWDSEEALGVFLETETFEDTPREFAGIEFEPHTYVVLMSRQNQQPNRGRDEPC